MKYIAAREINLGPENGNAVSYYSKNSYGSGFGHSLEKAKRFKTLSGAQNAINKARQFMPDNHVSYSIIPLEDG